MNKRPLVPGFLQKLDDRLLRNKPTTWAARTHFVLWFTFLFGVVLSASCWFAFYDSKQYHDIEAWAAFTLLLSGIGLIVWLIFLLRFNVFKRYGNWFQWDGLKGLLLYFISIAAMGIVSFIPVAIPSFIASQRFTANEIVQDVNEMNVTAFKLEQGILPLAWTVEKLHVVNTLPTSYDAQVEEDIDYSTDSVAVAQKTESVPISKYKDEYFRLIDTADFREKIAGGDSMVKLNDSLYLSYSAPEYTFVDADEATRHASIAEMGSAAVYREARSNNQQRDRSVLNERMQYFKKKYAADDKYDYTYAEDDIRRMPENADYTEKIKTKYFLYSIDNGIENICNKKYIWHRYGIDFLRIFLYSAFAFTLLVFMFRHTTIKIFFLTALTGILVMIISGFAIGMTRGDEKTALIMMLIYYALFVLFTLPVKTSTVQKNIHGIALNLCMLTTPFVPAIIWGLYCAIEHDPHRYEEYPIDYTNPFVYMPVAEISGVVIFLLLLQPVFRKLYRKWYAAPEN